MQSLLDSIDTFLSTIDISFKWILILMNFITVIGVYLHKRMNPTVRNHKILFLISHPDDECMFFRPTIVNLRESYFIHVLCLTGKNGDREKQLRDSCSKLKVDFVEVLEIQGIKDGLQEIWDIHLIKKAVLDYVRNNQIKAIFTFDRVGVSGHKNHIALHHAMKQLEVKTDTKANIKVYYLQSVNIIRKYSGAFEIVLALLKTFSWIQLSPISAYKCMSAHKSQFVWFRKLWVFFSRYQYVNTYQKGFIKIYEESQVVVKEEKQKLEKQQKQGIKLEKIQ